MFKSKDKFGLPSSDNSIFSHDCEGVQFKWGILLLLFRFYF